jgi:hypothetical protein
VEVGFGVGDGDFTGIVVGVGVGEVAELVSAGEAVGED